MWGYPVTGILRGASAAIVIAVAAWGLSAAPASAVGEPTTTPAITAPTDGANVSGDVNITATSTELQVQFYENGIAFGAPVATSGGVASTTWSTWGLANGGPVAWTAADCNDIGCNPVQSTAVSVSVLNDAPAITTPLDGSVSGATPNVTATAPGGAVAFAIDGTPAGVDLTAPYSQQVVTPLSDGPHTVVVQECDVAGALCSGPTATSNFTVVTLHPTITSVAPNPFSPRVDGRNDTTSFRVHLPDTESVSWSIKNSLSQTVNGPHIGGALAAGDHVFTWNGHNNANQIVGDGTFTITVATAAVSSGTTVHGSVTASVRVDDTPSVLHGAGGNGVTFYPVVDGYLDNFGPKVTANEGGTLWLQIYTTTGTLVAQIAQAHAGAGTFQINWNGHNRANALAAAGTYRFRFLAQDLAGNRSTTIFGTVYLSLRHLVTKVVTITKPGNPAILGTSDTTGCTLYSYTATVFAHGVALRNRCDYNVVGPQVILAEYLFAVPAAIRYNSIRLQSLGRANRVPQLLVGVINNWQTNDVDIVGDSTMGRANVNLTSIYGTVPAAGHINGSRHVDVAVALGDQPGGPDLIYDMGTVSIVVSYAVLN
jgi:flagellar hook assembly protein FlgD